MNAHTNQYKKWHQENWKARFIYEDTSVPKWLDSSEGTSWNDASVVVVLVAKTPETKNCDWWYGLVAGGGWAMNWITQSSCTTVCRLFICAKWPPQDSARLEHTQLANRAMVAVRACWLHIQLSNESSSFSPQNGGATDLILNMQTERQQTGQDTIKHRVQIEVRGKERTTTCLWGMKVFSSASAE